jgi:hypothetical protein
MNRRLFIQIGLTGLAGCSKSGQASEASMKAGPFSVSVPEKWSKTAIVEKVPIQPLYSPKAWGDLQKDGKSLMKPGYNCRPQHWALRFPAALPQGIQFSREYAGDDPTAPQILIHKADEWGVVSTDGKHEDVKVADVLHRLRKNMNESLIDGNPIQSPAITNSQMYDCLRRRIDFMGGHGIRLVTQWGHESNLMRFGDLHYFFLGMSDDNSCQIIASFPINLPALPNLEDNNHLGHSIENYDEFSRNYSEYVKDAEKWLLKNEHQISPSIQTLDRVIQSLVVSHWE